MSSSSTPAPTPTEVVAAFNAAINTRDLDALAGLMADDHRFVDSAGGAVDGKPASLDAWRGFFESFPDYRNEFDLVEEVAPGIVEVQGRSTCSVPDLDGPARWRVEVVDGKVRLWQVNDV